MPLASATSTFFIRYSVQLVTEVRDLTLSPQMLLMAGDTPSLAADLRVSSHQLLLLASLQFMCLNRFLPCSWMVQV